MPSSYQTCFWCWGHIREFWFLVTGLNFRFDLGLRAAVAVHTLRQHLHRPLPITLKRRSGRHTKRLGRRTIGEHPHVCVVISDGHEIARGEGRRKLRLEVGGVFAPHAKSRHGADVAEHRIPNGRIELRNELVRHREPQLVLPRFGKDRSDRWC